MLRYRGLRGLLASANFLSASRVRVHLRTRYKAGAPAARPAAGIHNQRSARQNKKQQVARPRAGTLAVITFLHKRLNLRSSDVIHSAFKSASEISAVFLSMPET